MTAMPRIALIHALEESVAPAHAAFRELWPEACCFDLLDTSLAPDLAETGRLDEHMMQRFQSLARYAARSCGRGGQTAGILFTCSAFGKAIDAAKEEAPIPVLRPNEAAFGDALGLGSSLTLVVTFAPSGHALEAELRAMAAERGQPIKVRSIVVEGALEALKSGDTDRHDRLVAEAVAPHAAADDVVVLGQFSLARARPAIKARTTAAIVTTPHSAVQAMRRLVATGG